MILKRATSIHTDAIDVALFFSASTAHADTRDERSANAKFHASRDAYKRAKPNAGWLALKINKWDFFFGDRLRSVEYFYGQHFERREKLQKTSLSSPRTSSRVALGPQTPPAGSMSRANTGRTPAGTALSTHIDHAAVTKYEKRFFFALH
jgi:hypothetical protein